MFEPNLPSTTADIEDDDDDDDETELSSVVDSEEWIGEDDRASDSIPPSILSESEVDRHQGLMQQPPRSTPFA